MNVKVIAIIVLALMVSYLSDALSEPPISLIEREYQEEFNAASKRMLSEKEYEALVKRGEKFLVDINSAENTEAALMHIIKRKAIAVPLAILIWFVVGLRIGFNDRKYLIAASIALVVFPLFFVNIIEALVYAAAFAIGNVLLLKKTRMAGSSTNVNGAG